MPSRFLDELPEKHVDVVEQTSSYGGYNVGGIGNYGASRFDRADPLRQHLCDARLAAGAEEPRHGRRSRRRAGVDPRVIEGELVAKSTGGASVYARGERVFHQKFGYGTISDIEGNKLTVEFSSTGPEEVVADSLASRGETIACRQRPARGREMPP